MQRLLLSNNAFQMVNVRLKDNGNADFTFRYFPTQNQWTFSVDWGSFKCRCQRMVSSPNCMRQFSRCVPFGMMVWSPFNVDPYFIDDFERERIFVYVIEGDDIDIAEIM
jgi:hypothetical protein